MKNKSILLNITLINILLFSSAQISASDESTDNALHLGASTLIGGASQYYFQNWKYSMATCVSVGLAKEIYDEADSRNFSKKDLALDGIGCTLGVLASSLIWPNDKDSQNKLSFSMADNEPILYYQYAF